MKLPLYWVDAFASEIFRGNPAAVVPLERWLPDVVMQRIAAENGLSETAFLVRTGPARFHLRWFTPAVEIDLCGHATLASAFVLFHHLGEAGEVIAFDSRSGPLLVRRRGPLLELDFPAQPPEPAAASAPLAQALGRPPQQFLRTKTRWLCVYDQAAEVADLRPDHARLARTVPGRITVTAPGADCDFVSRTFVPEVGIPEDPVTGSAHCTLVPYWAARLGRPSLHARQVSARGGELFCEWRGERVGIAGPAVLYLQGEINV
ncbi:MAG TPA: PhzF family phenazine biosynthesis protein [Lacunisphaera sp.]|jgi:PhzF family phenazine biosynthesis protein|nr:PhzF family phenazine biosynthesis protein [Lacunisphaera sp.]